VEGHREGPEGTRIPGQDIVWETNMENMHSVSTLILESFVTARGEAVFYLTDGETEGSETGNSGKKQKEEEKKNLVNEKSGPAPKLA